MKWKKNTIRFDVLKPYGLLNSLPEKVYDDITQLAAAICGTETSFITLLGDTEQLIKSNYGIISKQIPFETSFCKHMISQNTEELIVEDITKDSRFKKNYWVVSQPSISFYAGVLLTNSTGVPLGTLCVLDAKPKKLTEQQTKALHTLAKQLVQLFEYRKIGEKKKEIEAELKSKNQLLNTIIESTKSGIWEWEKQSDRLQLNEQGAAIAGYSSNELKQLKKAQWDKRIHPDDRWIIKDKVDRCHTNKNDIYEISYRIFHKNGDIIYIHETGKVTSWNTTNEPHTMQGTISNVSQKTNSDTELEKLRKNQEALINSTKDLLWSVDTSYKLIIANKPFKHILRNSLKHEISEGDSVFSPEFSEETIKRWKSYYDRALSGEQFSLKELIEDPSESSTPYGLVSFNPIYDKNEIVIGVSCFSKDITSDVRAQEDILNANKQMDKIMNASLDIICSIDADGVFLSINKACTRIWGYSPMELIGKSYTGFVCTEDIITSKEMEEKVVKGEKIPYLENRCIHKDNYLIPMRWSAKWDKDERVMYCIGRDVTAQKKIEQQIEQSERRFKTLVQDGSDLIGILNHEGSFIYVSPTSTRILNTPPEQFIGNKIMDYIHPDDSEHFNTQFKTIFKNPQITIEPFRFKNKEGKLLWIETIATNKLDDPFINGIILNSRDITERKRAVEQVEQSERRFKTLVQGSNEMIGIIDENANYVYASPTTTKMLNIDPETFIGTNAIENVHPDDQKMLEAKLLELLETKQSTTVSFRFKNKEGEWRWLESIATNLMHESSVKGIVLNTRDMTERKVAADRLEQSERRFKTLVQGGNEMIAIVDRNATYTYVSPTTTKILNIDPEAFIGTNAFEYLHPDDRNKVQARFLEILEHKQPITDTFRFKDRDGEWRWQETIATYRLDEPSINGIVLNTRDITDRKRAAEQLEQSERRFKTLVQEGTELIAIFDKEANFTYVSPTSNRTLKMSPELLVGTNAFDHIHPDDYEAVYAQFLETLEKPQVYIRPFRFKNGEGNWTWLETIATNKTDEPSINGIVVNTRDVTDRILHLNAIEEQNKVLRAISWNQSHVVRAPVARLMGLINVIKEEGPDSEEREIILNFIIDSAEEIDSVIKNNVEETTKLTDIETLK